MINEASWIGSAHADKKQCPEFYKNFKVNEQLNISAKTVNSAISRILHFLVFAISVWTSIRAKRT